ncbi:TPA: DUF3883 domain-containing protein [Klebsiella michiganensis]|nr:DUF3883 domain-containing protein [Klebsiella michiganensis]
MASNYMAICRENRESYGTKGAQKSGRLAAELYDDRTHFIFELLQNAEDALARRGGWQGERKVVFTLKQTQLTFSHFGKPFDEADVRSVCEIAESTKDESSIGRFGLGFKSVYTVTDFPEIHSGDEDFVIENYVFPRCLERSVRIEDETQIILPLRPGDRTITQDITRGLKQLGPRALLFLRYINEINWSIEEGASGFYLRSPAETLGRNVQRITVIGNEDKRPEVAQNWLIFHREVFSTEQQKVGRVEIAFLLGGDKNESEQWTIQPLAKSPLVVFFPTVIESNLGFLVQGPYRTTPGRDNIAIGEPWNQYLVNETSSLLVEAMHWMRDNSMLDISALRCLPLDREKFPEESLLAPMFNSVRHAFKEDALLPTFDNSHISAHQAKLARTQELRELFSSEQVSVLFGQGNIAWLSGEITQDKAPYIRQYIMRELDIEEITPVKMMPLLSKSFLEAQPDEWVLRLYEFLSGQEKALKRYLDTVPLIRLEDGTHVVANENGKAKAFLPCTVATSFPTMRSAVCATDDVRQFLNSLGISEPDPVDDVIWNIIPKYQQEAFEVGEDVYTADIERICAAYSTDSTAQRDKLRTALCVTNFVMVIDTGNGKSCRLKPRDIYIATDRLKQLFSGIDNIFIVDDSYSCLRGERIREVLESCGACRYPRPIEAPYELTNDEKRELRHQTGYETTSGTNDRITDWILDGADRLVELIPKLTCEQRVYRARLLWESLIDLEERRGRGVFDGSYTWSHYGERRTPPFPAAFVRRLNKAAWVPDANGDLVQPYLVVFDNLGWKSNPFLLTKIVFKPPIMDQLAKEAGIDPAILDFLRRDPDIIAELTSRMISNINMGLEAEPASTSNVYEDAIDLCGDDMPDIPFSFPEPDSEVMSDTTRTAQEYTYSGNQRNSDTDFGGPSIHGSSGYQGSEKSNWQIGQKRTSGHAGGRPFISYIGIHPNDNISNSDRLSQEGRMVIEAQAIELIIGLEPTLRRTPEGNPGFDLFEVDNCGRQIRWVEVKSMSGCLDDHPVGLSHTQFNYAREKGDAYWLYIVEYTTESTKARVLKIQNPVTHARTFTFDHGWRAIASIESIS